jgi:hypothetical protein
MTSIPASSWILAQDTFLTIANIPTTVVAPAVPPSVHHIAVIDCSGSMWDALRMLRDQLKNKLPTLVKENDTITIIWFSSRGEYGVLFEAVKIRDLRDLSEINKAIDRYLQAMCLTGFKEPLEEANKVIDRILSKDRDGVFSLFFMTDGHDNQWSQREILDVCDKLSDRLSAATIVEYGWYCNRPLLSKMAEAIGGTLIFSESFDQYAPVFESAIGKRIDGVKKRDITLPSHAKHEFALAIRGDEIVSYSACGGKVLLPEDVSEVFYLSETPVGQPIDTASYIAQASARNVIAPLPSLYALLAALSQRMLADDAFKVLKTLGDVTFIKQFASCFGKQAYSAFQDAANAAVFDTALRFAEGYDPTLVPAEDAYTVVDLLHDLGDDDDTKLHTAHPAFNYQRIGRKTVQAAGVLTKEEQEEIQALTANARTPAQLEAIKQRMDEILASKPKPVEFKATDKEAGVPISNLTFNESRPNVSVLTRIEGSVSLPEDAPANLPKNFPSFIFRNYTVIRDGILNLKTLPLTLGATSFDALKAQGLVDGPFDPAKVYEVNIAGLPIINRKMVKQTSATETFTLAWRLTQAKGAQKVFKFYAEKHFPKERAAGLKETYGEAAAEYLKGIGITDGGFSPKVVQEEATDFYMGRELKITIKGTSSLPKVDDTAKKMDDRKNLTTGDKLLAVAIQEYRDFIASSIYQKAAKPEHLLETWLKDKTEEAIKTARALNRKLAEIKFSVLVGQIWFKEFSSLDEGTLEFTVDGETLSGTATLKEIEVKI